MASTGVLMFGAGMVMGAMIPDNHDHYYSPWYSAPYSYGCGARYSYAHGGYYRGAAAYGPYGGAGAAAAYNPRTGTYARGAYAYGPAGSASVRQAYNPYTGTRARSARVDTAYGSAGRGAAYNPNTGTAVRGGYRSSSYGSAAGVQTNRGSGAVAWDTNQGQGAVVKDRQGNVYPRLIRLDLDVGVMHAVTPEHAGRRSSFEVIDRSATKIVLRGYENGRAFSGVLDEPGMLALSASVEGTTFSVFASCTDLGLIVDAGR